MKIHWASRNTLETNEKNGKPQHRKGGLGKKQMNKEEPKEILELKSTTAKIKKAQ